MRTSGRSRHPCRGKKFRMPLAFDQVVSISEGGTHTEGGAGIKSDGLGVFLVQSERFLVVIFFI